MQKNYNPYYIITLIFILLIQFIHIYELQNIKQQIRETEFNIYKNYLAGIEYYKYD